MARLEPVAVTRLYRMISRQIAEKIQAGEYPVGSRLQSERDLAAGLRVGRNTVREALIALELDGYVEIRIGAGVFVGGGHPYTAGYSRRSGQFTRAGGEKSDSAASPVEHAAQRAADMKTFETIV